MKRLVGSAKFWTAVIGAIAVLAGKLQWNMTAEELAALITPFALVIAAIAGEDIAEDLGKKKE
jgi:uncharacterized membrane protein